MKDLFYGTNGPQTACGFVVGESWGEIEAAKQQAFVGQSGQELDRILSDAGISRTDLLGTNIRAEQPPANKMEYFFHSNADAKQGRLAPLRRLYPDDETLAELYRYHRQIDTVKPRIIIGCGNWNLWANTRASFRTDSQAPAKGVPTRTVPVGITSWRGSQLYADSTPQPTIPFVPIIHPAAIMREWTWRAVTVHDLRTRVKPVLEGGQWKVPQRRFIVRPDFKTTCLTLDYLYALPPQSRIAVDGEMRSGFIACLGYAWTKLDAICIPFMCVENDNGYWTPDEEAIIRSKITALHSRKDLVFVLQNAAWDFQYFDLELIPLPRNVHDTMLFHHLILPGTPKGLDYLSSMYCEHHVYWKDEGKLWDEDMPEEQLWSYNCLDSASTLEVDEILCSAIARQSRQALAQERIDQLFLAHDMVRNGGLINQHARAAQIQSVLTQRNDREDFLSRCIPQHLLDEIKPKSSNAAPWYNSPYQQMKLFYDELNFPERIDRKTKSRTMDDEALKRIEEFEPLLQPITKAIRECRSLGVYFSNFLSAQIDPDDRMRCSYNVSGASTFRWSSNKNAFGRGTNLMNIPKGVDKG